MSKTKSSPSHSATSAPSRESNESSRKGAKNAKKSGPSKREPVTLGPLNALPDQLMVKGGDIVFKDGRPAQPTFDALEGKTVTVVEREPLHTFVEMAKGNSRNLGLARHQRHIAESNLEQQNTRITDLLAKQSALVEQVEQLERQLRDERCARGALELAIELLGKGLGTR